MLEIVTASCQKCIDDEESICIYVHQNLQLCFCWKIKCVLCKYPNPNQLLVWVWSKWHCINKNCPENHDIMG